MVSDKPGGPECVQPPSPPRKLTAQLKSPFGDSCFTSLCGGFFPDRAKVSATLAPEVLSQSTEDEINGAYGFIRLSRRRQDVIFFSQRFALR